MIPSSMIARQATLVQPRPQYLQSPFLSTRVRPSLSSCRSLFWSASARKNSLYCPQICSIRIDCNRLISKKIPSPSRISQIGYAPCNSPSPIVSPNFQASRSYRSYLKNSFIGRLPDQRQVQIQNEKPSLVSKIKAFVKQYYYGLKKLKEQLPEYRALSSQPSGSLTRKQAIFVNQTKSDLKILAPFVVCLIVIPELIPFFVIKNWVPSTCLNDEQVDKSRNKLYEMRAVISRRVVDFASSSKFKHFNPEDIVTVSSVVSIAAKYPDDFKMCSIGRKQLSFYCQYMGLSSIGLHRTFERRLLNLFEEIKQDDQKIMKEGIESLSDSELLQAVERRGISFKIPFKSPFQERKRNQLHTFLKDWITLNLAMDGQVEKGLIVFSRMMTMGKIVENEKQ